MPARQVHQWIDPGEKYEVDSWVMWSLGGGDPMMSSKDLIVSKADCSFALPRVGMLVSLGDELSQ